MRAAHDTAEGRHARVIHNESMRRRIGVQCRSEINADTGKGRVRPEGHRVAIALGSARLDRPAVEDRCSARIACDAQEVLRRPHCFSKGHRARAVEGQCVGCRDTRVDRAAEADVPACGAEGRWVRRNGDGACRRPVLVRRRARNGACEIERAGGLRRTGGKGKAVGGIVADGEGPGIVEDDRVRDRAARVEGKVIDSESSL